MVNPSNIGPRIDAYRLTSAARPRTGMSMNSGAYANSNSTSSAVSSPASSHSWADRRANNSLMVASRSGELTEHLQQVVEIDARIRAAADG